MYITRCVTHRKYDLVDIQESQLLSYPVFVLLLKRDGEIDSVGALVHI